MKRTFMVSMFVGIILLALSIGESGHNMTHIQDTRVETDAKETTKGEPSPNELTFSNTQTWDTEFLKKATEPSAFSSEQLATISLPPPPANDSTTTSAELADLHAKVALRTPEKLAEIQEELSLGTSVFGNTTLQEQKTIYDRPYTTALAQMVLDLADPIILAEKLRYNRVRPSHLDPTLTIAIDLPNHPAYPSGHSTQSHLIAEMLSKLDPQNREEYFASAKRIAENREIAGVHYASDTKAGMLLAEQILPLLFTNPEFLEVYTEAQKEWKFGL